jgi:pilus assembly protein CpaF
MPIRDKVLEELLEKIGLRYRPRVQKAIRYEEEKAIEKALSEWEEIVAEARREGKDVSVLQNHLKRLHQLWWQKGGPQRREPLPEVLGRGGIGAEKEVGRERDESYAELKSAFRSELQRRCIGEGVEFASQSEENLLRIRSLLDEIIKERLKQIPDWVKRKDLMEEIMNDVLGLGVLEEYLQDPKVNEVMINGNDIYYEREGRILEAPRGFENPDEVRKVIERIIHPIGRRVDESSPLVDGRLPDGSRVNIVVPPVALDGPVITIRKFSRSMFTADTLIENTSISEQMAEFFRLIVVHRLNVMITGRTSSGKTTLLNLLSNFIPAGERIVTIEDMAELQLSQRHVVRLEARAPNIQGKGEVTIRTLFRNALHMRPDRIIVGECRGAETLDMLQAMNTGHDGSISTAHSNSPRDLFARLEAMIGMSDLALHSRTVRKQIASGIDIVVYCTRYPDGQRKVTSVCEIQEGDTADEDIVLREIFRFDRKSSRDSSKTEGRFLATGFIPSFVREHPDLSGDQSVFTLFQADEGGHGGGESAPAR